MKISLDLGEIDKKFLTKEQREEYVNRLQKISKLARKYLNQKRISKTTYNRIHRLWLFIPREDELKQLVSTEEFCRIFKVKPLNLTYTQNALDKLFIEIKKENSQSISEVKND